LGHVEGALNELAVVGLIAFCSCAERKCQQYTNFGKFQTLKGDRKPQIGCSDPGGFQWKPVDSPKLSKEKGSKEKENVDFIDDFEDWWVRYPNKQGKTNALRYYSHWRKTKTAIEMHQARENYLQNKARYSSEVYSNGSTFLNPSPPSGCTSANIADYFPPPPAVMKARLEKALATLQKQKADLIAGRTPKEMDGSEIDRANEITLKIREVKAELEAICDQE
jgi:hypothetical protein